MNQPILSGPSPSLLRLCNHYAFVLAFVLMTQSFVCAAQKSPQKRNPVLFKKQIISSRFISEGVATGDVNNDGRPDILAGNCWYEAPSWKQHYIHADTLDPIPGYSTTFINFSMDVNSDGWADLIRFDQPGAACYWYENPRGKKGLWRRHLIAKTQGMETPAFADVDGDGRKDLICNDPVAKEVVWLKAPAGRKETDWQRFVISRDSTRGTHMYTHGLGWGDVNKDGRNDVFIREGWWEAPADAQEEGWKFHRADFGQDCANMFALDVDGDGDQDIISSSAHNYGIWWHEQKQSSGGAASWTTHEISRLFSQTHSLALADINGDGHADLVTGKRYFAHNGRDPGALEPAVLYWFEYRPGRAPQWIAHHIDDDSGVGTNMEVTDMNNDGLPDIITSNKKGVFLFAQVKQKQKKKRRS